MPFIMRAIYLACPLDALEEDIAGKPVRHDDVHDTQGDISCLDIAREVQKPLRVRPPAAGDTLQLQRVPLVSSAPMFKRPTLGLGFPMT